MNFEENITNWLIDILCSNFFSIWQKLKGRTVDFRTAEFYGIVVICLEIAKALTLTIKSNHKMSKLVVSNLCLSMFWYFMPRRSNLKNLFLWLVKTLAKLEK